MHTARKHSCVTLLGFLLVSAAAQAQLNPAVVSSSMGNISFASSSAMSSNGLAERMGQTARVGFSNPAIAPRGFFGGGTSAAASAAGADFAFSPSQPVREQTKERFIEASARGNASTRAQLEQALNGDAVLKEFTRLLSSFGYSSTNLVDVSTAYYIICWEVVNGQDASQNGAGIRSVHDQLLSAYSDNAQAKSLSDAQKQELAETMAYLATIAGASKNYFVQKGDRQSLEQLRSAVRQGVLQTGVDVSRLRLTSQGFVPAS